LALQAKLCRRIKRAGTEIMSSNHQNGNGKFNGMRTEQALRASEFSCQRSFKAAKDGDARYEEQGRRERIFK
jgi:hypothetical protein